MSKVLEISGAHSGLVVSFFTKLGSMVDSAKDLIDAACTKFQLETEAASETEHRELKAKVEIAELRARSHEAEARIVKAKYEKKNFGRLSRGLDELFRAEREGAQKLPPTGGVKEDFKRGTRSVDRPPRRPHEQPLKNDSLKQEIEKKVLETAAK